MTVHISLEMDVNVPEEIETIEEFSVWLDMFSKSLLSVDKVGRQLTIEFMNRKDQLI